jgi:foldase protein PrsA
MNPRPARTTLTAVVCAAALAALVAGCGGIPGDAVATVDGNPITKASFNHWMTVAAKSSGQTGTAIPQPPDYKACIAAKRKALPKPGKGQPTTTDAQLKTQCAQQYQALRDQVVQLLISFQWIQGEAKAQNVKVTDAEVKKQFETQKKASFPKDSDYQKFLKQSGYTQQDIMLRVKLEALSTKLRAKVTKGSDKVTQADIQKYYNDNKARFGRPETRDLLVVLTKTQAKAQQAKQAIQGGQSFASVAKKYSIDPTSKSQGGKLTGVAKGSQEKALDTAIFGAKKGVLTGPVKTQFGYYVFKVTKVTPASQQSLAQASTTIKQLLASQKQQKALDTFVKSFQKRWKAKTECRKGYQTQDCKNAPKATPTPTPATNAPAPTTTPAQ